MSIVNNMTTDQQINVSAVPIPSDGMEDLYYIPETLAAIPKYVQMYTTIRDRLRRESAGLTMNSIQLMLLERIASMYVIIRAKEDGTLTWAGVTQQREFNDYYLKLTSEFNKILTSGQDKLREALLMEIMETINKSLEVIEDKETRRLVRRTFSAKFAEMNI